MEGVTELADRGGEGAPPKEDMECEGRGAWHILFKEDLARPTTLFFSWDGSDYYFGTAIV